MCITEQNTMNFNCGFVLMVSRDYWYYMVLQITDLCCIKCLTLDCALHTY